MVLIEQLDKEGCAIACLAMVLGCDYYTMRSKLDTCGDLLRRYGKPNFELKFWPKEICAVLKQFGFKGSYVKWEPHRSQYRCILLLTPIKNPEYTHAVIHDNGMIFDPLLNNPQPLLSLEDYNVYCCIGDLPDAAKQKV